MQIKHNILHIKFLLSSNSPFVIRKQCLASQNNHPTSLVSSWDISIFKQSCITKTQGSLKVAHLFILVVCDVLTENFNLFTIHYCLDFAFFMSMTHISNLTRMTPVMSLITLLSSWQKIKRFFVRLLHLKRASFVVIEDSGTGLPLVTLSTL